MAHTTPSELRDSALAVAFAALVAVVWYVVYVGPADAAREAVMDCMIEQGDLHSRDAYDACVAELRGEK
jgi:hypothetical protein